MARLPTSKLCEKNVIVARQQAVTNSCIVRSMHRLPHGISHAYMQIVAGCNVDRQVSWLQRAANYQAPSTIRYDMLCKTPVKLQHDVLTYTSKFGIQICCFSALKMTHTQTAVTRFPCVHAHTRAVF